MPRPPQPAKVLIAARGEMISEVAAAIGVNAHALGRILNGHTPPWPKLVDDLAEHLDADAGDLFHDQDTPLAAAVEQVINERVAAGLPRRIEDPAVLASVAKILREAS